MGTRDDPGADNAGVKLPPPLIPLIAVLAGYGLQRVWALTFPEQVIWSFLGWALVGVATAITVMSWIQFGKAKTNILPHKPSSAIIRDGLYRFSRNPIYLTFLIFQAGVGLLMNNLWVMLLLPVTFILLTKFVIVREEAYLEREFGEDYRSFKRTVRRWL